MSDKRKTAGELAADLDDLKIWVEELKEDPPIMSRKGPRHDSDVAGRSNRHD